MASQDRYRGNYGVTGYIPGEKKIVLFDNGDSPPAMRFDGQYISTTSNNGENTVLGATQPLLAENGVDVRK
jgi:hypothetical protein